MAGKEIKRKKVGKNLIFAGPASSVPTKAKIRDRKSLVLKRSSRER
jgi:hypothetical protein